VLLALISDFHKTGAMQRVNVSMTFVAPSANMPLKCALYAFTVMFYFFCELRVYGHKFHPLPSTYSEK